ncbi:hypothetical protein OG21DRAFT_273059 [Imleria badia]|nr:hypothetical protein OG21DRAFT_273059 [Imleria badia]
MTARDRPYRHLHLHPHHHRAPARFPNPDCHLPRLLLQNLHLQPSWRPQMCQSLSRRVQNRPTPIAASTPENETYSLPPPPPWPPSPSEYPPGRNFKIIYDPITDKDRDGRMRALVERICVVDKYAAYPEPRINGKGKCKETIARYDGEVIEGEVAPVPKDLRKGSGFKRRPGREAFHEVKYEVRHSRIVGMGRILTWSHAYNKSMINIRRVHHRLRPYSS